MAKARFEIPTQLPAQVPALVAAPLHAGVDAATRVVGLVREGVTDVSKRALAVQEDATARVDAFGKDAAARRRAVEQRMTALQADAKQLPERLQKLLDGQVAAAGETYAGLVKQGEIIVGRIRRQQPTQLTVEATTMTKPTTKPTTKKATAKKATAKKAPAKKAPAKKATAKKATAKRATAKKA
jgi:hypothetical protein